jgi:heme/copper-type cytochrome/quinol oxidase subunit 2
MFSLPTLATVPPLRLAHEHDATAAKVSGLFFRSAGMNDAAIETDGLFMLIFWFSVFFFVLLMGLMVYWGFFKYRRRPGVPIERSPSHNGPLEIFWTVVPSSALLVIFFLGLWTYTTRQIGSGDALELNLKGWKWGWAITYPNGAESQWALTLDPGGTQSAPVFIVPEDTDISLVMSSQDVIHSFWIPDYRVKMDVFPNRYTGYSFRTATLPADAQEDPDYGRYQDHWIFCAEYCGDYHSEMAAVLRVMTPAGYAKAMDEFDIGNKSPIEIGRPSTSPSAPPATPSTARPTPARPGSTSTATSGTSPTAPRRSATRTTSASRSSSPTRRSSRATPARCRRSRACSTTPSSRASSRT